MILLPNRNNDSFKNMGGMSGTSKQQIEKRIQSRVNKGLAKEGSVVLQPGFSTRFLVTSKKSKKRSKKEDKIKCCQIKGFEEGEG